jgi:hypothetical protein
MARGFVYFAGLLDWAASPALLPAAPSISMSGKGAGRDNMFIERLSQSAI